MSKIYIACGLTHIPRQFFSDYSNNIHKLAAKLEKSGHTVKYALKHSDPQLSEVEKHLKPELCYLWDKNMIPLGITENLRRHSLSIAEI